MKSIDADFVAVVKFDGNGHIDERRVLGDWKLINRAVHTNPVAVAMVHNGQIVEALAVDGWEEVPVAPGADRRIRFHKSGQAPEWVFKIQPPNCQGASIMLYDHATGARLAEPSPKQLEPQKPSTWVCACYMQLSLAIKTCETCGVTQA